jgi:NAD(P)-dependent dehydrogenase (short-subunit alcohol dehydrogenase family)
MLDTPVDVLEKHVQGNALSPFLLNHYFLPPMLKKGGGTIIYITSTAAYQAPPTKVGEGGWGLCYSMSKAAGHSLAGQLAVEYGDQGIRAFNVQPGPVKTERLIQDMAGFGFNADNWAPPEVIGEVCLWLAENSAADKYNGQCLQGQDLCVELDLVPGWKPAHDMA